MIENVRGALRAYFLEVARERGADVEATAVQEWARDEAAHCFGYTVGPAIEAYCNGILDAPPGADELEES